jgi:hypothetical protein
MNDIELKKCPLCGANAFVKKDEFDGYYFGWSVGCPRACIGDRTHKIDDPIEFRKARLTMHGFDSKQQAVNEWNNRVENV